MVFGKYADWIGDDDADAYKQRAWALEKELEIEKEALRACVIDKQRIAKAYTALQDLYEDLTSRMTDAELDEVRAREKS